MPGFPGAGQCRAAGGRIVWSFVLRKESRRGEFPVAYSRLFKYRIVIVITLGPEGA